MIIASATWWSIVTSSARWSITSLAWYLTGWSLCRRRLLVNISVITITNRAETAWDLKDSDGITLLDFFGDFNEYDNDTPYRFQMCVECNAFFTLTLYDQFDDG